MAARAACWPACIAVEEFGRVCYNTGYLLVVQWVAFGALQAAGNSEQKARFLPGLASGELRGAFSTTEAHSGSDVSGITTRATRVAGGYRLSGAKIWCTNSDMADFISVGGQVRRDDGKRQHQSLHRREGHAGIHASGARKTRWARAACPPARCSSTTPSCPRANRMGPEGGQGFKLVMEAFNTSPPHRRRARRGPRAGGDRPRIGVSAERARPSVARSATFQGLRWMIADMAMQTEAARQLTYKVASVVDAGVTGPELGGMAAMAKCFASDVAMKVATDAVQLFGAAGVSNEYPINRYFRDAKVVQIIEGTNQIQRNIIANVLLGRESRR